MFETGFKTFFPIQENPLENKPSENSEVKDVYRDIVHKRTKSDITGAVDPKHLKSILLEGGCGLTSAAAVSRFFNDECDDISDITNAGNGHIE
jgi:hypothetical protein